MTGALPGNRGLRYHALPLRAPSLHVPQGLQPRDKPNKSFCANVGRRGSCRALRVTAASQSELAAASAQPPISRPGTEQPQQSYFSRPRLRSPYDAEIAAIAVPALASLALDPVMNLVNSGE